jgi:hypothetical protein
MSTWLSVIGRFLLVRSTDFADATCGDDHRPRNRLMELGA